MTTTPNRESVYDAEMSPLVAQLIAIAKRANISLHVGVQLDGDLRCTTNIPANTVGMDEEQAEVERGWAGIYNRVMQGSGAVARSPLHVTTRNADGKVTEMAVIL